MNRGLKRITPFFILVLCIIIWSIYILFNEGLEWTIFIVLILLALALFILIIDFGLKKWLKSYKRVFIIEATFIFFGLLINQFQERSNILILSEDFDRDYVTIVYGFENAEPLNNSFFYWNSKVEIPKSGIFLTSSDFNEHLKVTKMKLNSGAFLNSKETDKGFIPFSESEINLSEKTYKFRSWKVQDEFCCFYFKEEKDEFKLKLKKEFEEIKKD